jgi:ABC-type glycerol-3-phosphate transport system substrate-binding protein
MGGVHVTVLYYNKALLDKAGAQPPKTTDDLQALVAPLKGAGASPMVHPSGEVWYNPLLVMWIQPMVVENKPVEFTERTQKGEVKYNSPEWLKTFQIIADLAKNGVLLPGSGAIGNDASIQLLYQGKAAMLYQGSWTYSSLKSPPAGAAYDLHVTGLPIVPPAPRAQPLIAFGGYSIPAASKNKDAAMSFVKFAADPEIDARVVEAVQQFSPVSASNAKITDPVSKEIAPWFKDGVPPLDWLWEPEITTEIQNLVQTLVKGEGTPQAAGDAVQAKAEQLRREGRSYYK